MLSFPKIIPTVRKSNQKDVDQKNIKQRAFNSRGSYVGHLMTISLKGVLYSNMVVFLLFRLKRGRLIVFANP